MKQRSCAACGRKLRPNPYLANTEGGKAVYVGTGCYKSVKSAGAEGWKSPLGPRLFLIPLPADWNAKHSEARA